MKVGDMFIIVKPTPCCKSDIGLGRIYAISGFWTGRGLGLCELCGSIFDVAQMDVLYVDEGKEWGIERSRIRIIPPDIDMAETEREEIA